jgi:uncharacterized protein YcbK (DUF882 family)
VEVYNSFKCKCGCGELKIDSRLVCLIERISRLNSVDITILSGYRCESHNKTVGGVANSTHVKGLACDFTCMNLKSVASSLNDHEGGFKYYADKNFIHIDIDRKRRW